VGFLRGQVGAEHLAVELGFPRAVAGRNCHELIGGDCGVEAESVT
jgi:hypothetical protein